MVKNPLPVFLQVEDEDGSLPLHDAAARQAPVEVVQALIAAHPGAAKAKDGRERLPLHDAAEHHPALAPAGLGERASLEKGAANTATTPVEAQLSTSIAPQTG